MPFDRPTFSATWRRLLPATLGVALLATPARAQRREYLVELSAAAAYTSYASVTDLDPGAGGIGRLGIWLPANLGLELELGFGSPSTTGGASVDVLAVAGSVLYNFRIGESSSAFLRAGLGSATYGSSCATAPLPGSTLCGTTGTLIGAAGFRAAISPTVLIRTEAELQRNRDPEGFTNAGLNLGLSLMLGSRRLADQDGDGVYDKFDRCLATPPGAIIDQDGCPSDTDLDGVLDGLDRCPNTPRGATVNEAGCPSDADRDGIVDGVDRCEATPAGAQVDATGCSSDSDTDGIVDGLDRCAETPAGATVDPLGCPGDQDGDRVLDGIDRCPGTPPGIAVNGFGCPPSQDSDRDGVVDAVDKCPGTPFGNRSPRSAARCGGRGRRPSALVRRPMGPPRHGVCLQEFIAPPFGAGDPGHGGDRAPYRSWNAGGGRRPRHGWREPGGESATLGRAGRGSAGSPAS
jgi:hypothetical protein